MPPKADKATFFTPSYTASFKHEGPNTLSEQTKERKKILKHQIPMKT